MNETKRQWRPRPEVPAEVKVSSLRRGLIWTFSVIQAVFIVFTAFVYIQAELVRNGDGWHDLGVTLGRELILNQVFTLWMINLVVVPLALGGVYFFLKDRWTRVVRRPA